MSLIGTMYKEPRVFAHRMVPLESLTIARRVPRTVIIIDGGTGFGVPPTTYGPLGTGEVVTTNGNGVNISMQVAALAHPDGAVLAAAPMLSFTIANVLPDGYKIGDRLSIESPTPGGDPCILEVTVLYTEDPSSTPDGSGGIGKQGWEPYYPIVYKNSPYNIYYNTKEPLTCYDNGGTGPTEVFCAYGSVGIYIGQDGDYTFIDEAGFEVEMLGLKAGSFLPILVVSVVDGPADFVETTLALF